MRASIFKTGMMMAKIIFATLKVCGRTVVDALFRIPITREKIDRRIHWWAQQLIKIADVRLSVVGIEKIKYLPGKRYVIMCNHASHYDIPITFVAIPGSIRMIAKEELSRIPIFGKALKLAEFIFIDRKNLQQAIQNMAQAKTKMESGIVIWIAPEGTRTHTGQLSTFKKGGFRLAIDTGATIIPIGIRGTARVLPTKTWQFSCGENVEVHIGNPIETTDYSTQTLPELMQIVRTQMTELTIQI